ncbi:PKD repeat-containing protein [Maribacter orientalis]|uniref:PKD repeat-containing protein n=1 Tax=Maribacter orientalis TaxID=228957 RepID=A0A1H7WLW2_9FLAO|nr:PKD domain-containing protein [Maribacter orientalis]SEM22125.1 PKD repeat-containing protein [Maribacter orientalis]
MKKNYPLNLNTIKKPALVVAISAFVLMAMSFGPMFLGPGLTVPKPFAPFVDTAFSDLGTATPTYEIAFPNLTFDSPIIFTPVPNQTKIVVGQLDGNVYWIEDDNNTANSPLIVNLSDEVGDRNEGEVWDGGFLGLSIHPDFGTAGKNYFFIYYTTSGPNSNLGNPAGFFCGVETFAGNYLKLERFEVDPTTMTMVDGTRVTMINRELYNTTHRGGGMVFGDDGFLYLSTGDQATYLNAQNISENLDGGVLRIDVDMIGGAVSHAPRRFLQDPGVGNTHPNTEGLEMSGDFYYIPENNPFNDASGAVFEEYVSIGNRSPHRMTKDKDTGILYIGEVGENTHEEVNVLDPTILDKKNYGWPFYEANAPFSPPTKAGTPCNPIFYPGTTHSPPLTQFTRAEATSITGGYVYRGSNLPGLVGKYICADYGQTDAIYEIDINTGSKQSLGTFLPLDIISFGQDDRGELYLLRLGNNSNIYRLKASIDLEDAPGLLSQTGAFTDLTNLTVADGFVPYEMIESFWSDGALKKRWIGIPNNGTHDTPAEQIEFSENGNWIFPVGSIIIKHFDYSIDDNDPTITRKIETRFSIKGSDGNFYFLTYKWLSDESDAVLVDMEVGETISIDIDKVGGGQRQEDWMYPSNSQCISCHNPDLGGTLGLRTRNLNSEYDYSSHDPSGILANQLVTLGEEGLGILNINISDTDTPGYLTHVAIDDPNGTLDQKARSYLDNNCAYCHQPDTGNRANFDLRLLNTLAQTGLLTAGYNQAVPDLPSNQRILIPGDAANSQVYHRAQSLVPGIKMPPLSKNVVDTEGVALIQAWIDAMEPIAPTPNLDTYRLVNYATKATMQVADASNVQGTNVLQGGYEGLNYQHWALENATELNYFKFKAISSNRYLDVTGFGDGKGVNVWQWLDNTTVSQQWQIVDAGNNTFHIIARVNGNFLGIEPNGNVVVGTDDGSDIYRWEFLPTSAPFTIGIDIQSNLVVTSEEGTTDDFDVALKSAPVDDVVLLVYGADATDEVTLSVTELTFTAANWDIPQTVTATGVDDVDVDGVQYYNIEIAVDGSRSDAAFAGFIETLAGYNEDNDGGAGAPPAPGTYRLINVDSGLSAEVVDAGTVNGVNMEQGLYQGDAHQQFELVYRDNGLYALIAQHSGKAMDVEQGNANRGTNVWQFTANETVSQLWTIQDAGNNTYHIISELGGHYLTIDANGNILVDVDNGADAYRWRFEDITTLGNTGINVSQDILFTNEDGDTDTFTVSLKEAPTAPVTVGIQVVVGVAEASVSVAQLIFDDTNWNVLQTVTVTGLDDVTPDLDGAQDFVVEAVVIAPFNDPKYSSGIGDTVAGINYDNDGGDNGGPVAGIYQIRNVGNQLNMMPDDGTLEWQVNMGTGIYDASEYQHFELIAEGNGLYSIRFTQQDGTGRDLYLDNQGGSNAPGTNIWSYIESIGSGRIAQLFQIVNAGDGSYFIINALLPPAPNTTNHLTVEPNGNLIANTNVDNNDFFKWEFLPTGFAPEAIATASTNAGNAPLAIQFTGSASTDDKNNIVTYLWDFGNGDTSTDADPNYSFTQGGTFNVTLTVTDGDGYEDISDPIEIVVNGAPEAVASADIINGIAALEVAFTGDQSTDAEGLIAYAWNFGDSANSTEANPVHIFASEGTYNVVLTVTDEGGLEDTDTITIVVTPNMAPVAVASSDVTDGDAPLEVNFIGDQSTDDDVVVSYSWNFGDGTSSVIANPAHTFNVDGTYEVVLTVTDVGGLEDTETLTITANRANGAPVAIATADVEQGGAPLEVSFIGDQSTDDVGIVTYAWNFNDGTISSEANPVHTFVNVGTYDVVLTVTDSDGLLDNETVTITVTTANEAPVAIAQADITQGEAPLVVSFSGNQSTDDVGIVSYNWDFGDGISVTDADAVHTFTTVGIFEVILTVTDEGGLQDTDAISITVTDGSTNMSPVAVVSANATEGLAPLEVTFTGDQSTDDVGITAYNWDFGDGTTSSETNPVHTFSIVGSYDVMLTVTDDGGLQNTDVITITVTDNLDNMAPVAVANADVIVGAAPLEVIFTGDKSTDDLGITTYTWDFGDGTTSSEVNPQHVFDVIGVFDVLLTVTDEQGLESTANITITVTEEQPSFEFILAPNPSIEYVEVIMKDNFNMDEILGVMMHDSAGRLIRQYIVDDVLQDGRLRIPTGAYRNEVYVITLMFNNNEPVSKRLIIN